ncbi:MAG: hypothetical protein ISP71_04395 [Flavobacteriales bacterium]|nr:hypothetical protein [Flavobacteriales bacterium]
MKEQYLTLAEIFKYPKKGYVENVKKCSAFLNRYYPEAGSSFKRFLSYVEGKDLFEIEEVFGFTFHIQAICYLDIGYVLFGEDYSRGEFLVNMKNEQLKLKHDCGEELADNLPHVLHLIAVSEDKTFVDELVQIALIPAVEKMLEEFETGRMALKNKVMKKKQKAIIMENISDGNIYQNALQALLMVLKTDFNNDSEIPAYSATPVGLANLCGGGCSFTTTKTTKK